MSLRNGFNPLTEGLLSDSDVVRSEVEALKRDAKSFEDENNLEAAADCRRELASRLEEAAEETGDPELARQCQKAAREHRMRARYIDPRIDLEQQRENTGNARDPDTDTKAGAGQDVVSAQQSDSSTQEGLTDIGTWITPETGFEALAGIETVEQNLREKFLVFMEHPDIFGKYYTDMPQGVIMHGPSGTGKTSSAKALAAELTRSLRSQGRLDEDESYRCLSVNCPDIKDSLVGESAKNVTKVFEAARANEPSMILFDEIDALAPARSDLNAGNGGQAHIDVISTILSEVSELEGTECFCVGTTNRLEAVDLALVQAQRFHPIRVDLPDETARRDILDLYLEQSVVDRGSVNLSRLARATEEFSGGDLEGVVKRAGVLAGMDELEGSRAGIRQQHLEQAAYDIAEMKHDADTGTGWL